MREEKRTEAMVVTETMATAHAVGLRYVTDQTKGITRKRDGRGFVYLTAQGTRVTDPKDEDRIRKLVIPPAWRNVWICSDPGGHLQATGIDDRGRKQYLYHPQWRKVRSQTKYCRMIQFGELLPTIRAQVERDLAAPGLTRERVLATVIALLGKTMIRVGNEEYSREHRSFGLTTLRDRHVDVRGPNLRFEFRGKSGVYHSIHLEDRRLAHIVQNCREIPGYELFQYLDEKGRPHKIGSEDVNEYLQAITGQDFTAKDFRTWGGTVLAAVILRELGDYRTGRQAKKNVVEAIRGVSTRLGNRPAVCRTYYVHPAIIDAYMKRTLIPTMLDEHLKAKSRFPFALSPSERSVLAILRQASGTPGQACATINKIREKHPKTTNGQRKIA